MGRRFARADDIPVSIPIQEYRDRKFESYLGSYCCADQN